VAIWAGHFETAKGGGCGITRGLVRKVRRNQPEIESLLRVALLRTAHAAEAIGARALLVHAEDDEAESGMSLPAQTPRCPQTSAPGLDHSPTQP
jgi:hypothetical protein